MKHNVVRQYGMVAQKPRIIKDEDGAYVKGIVVLNVVRNDRYTGDTNRQIKQDTPVIMSEIPEIIEVMESLNQFDHVNLKGVLTTLGTVKPTTCPYCHTQNSKDGMIVYVTPIFLEKVAGDMTQTESVDLLYRHKEISNEITAIGTLCQDPIKVNALKKTPITQFQIALTRTFRINEDKTDFPWVKSYGANAIENAKRLKIGSGVLIDGCLQARNITRKTTCDYCGEEFEWHDAAMEIVPYEIEYLTNFFTDDDLELMRK